MRLARYSARALYWLSAIGSMVGRLIPIQSRTGRIAAGAGMAGGGVLSFLFFDRALGLLLVLSGAGLAVKRDAPESDGKPPSLLSRVKRLVRW